MDIEFDFKGDPIGGVITNCKYIYLSVNHLMNTDSQGF